MQISFPLKAEASDIREMHQRTYVGPKPAEFNGVELKKGVVFLLSDEDKGFSMLRAKFDQARIDHSQRLEVMLNSRGIRENSLD